MQCGTFSGACSSKSSAVDGIRADDFIGGDANPQSLRAAHRPRREATTTCFGKSPAGGLRSWRCRSAERSTPRRLKIPSRYAGRERHFGQQRPVQHFFDVEHRQAESFAAAAEDAELRFGRVRSSIGQAASSNRRGVCVGGQRCQMQKSSASCEPPHGPDQFLANVKGLVT